MSHVPTLFVISIIQWSHGIQRFLSYIVETLAAEIGRIESAVAGLLFRGLKTLQSMLGE